MQPIPDSVPPVAADVAHVSDWSVSHAFPIYGTPWFCLYHLNPRAFYISIQAKCAWVRELLLIYNEQRAKPIPATVSRMLIRPAPSVLGTQGPGETQIFRLIPVVGRSYKSAVATRKVWDSIYEPWLYYTTQPLRFMGRFVRSESSGSGDGKTYAEFFDLSGQEVRLDYDYEETTCLVTA